MDECEVCGLEIRCSNCVANGTDIGEEPCWGCESYDCWECVDCERGDDNNWRGEVEGNV